MDQHKQDNQDTASIDGHYNSDEHANGTGAGRKIFIGVAWPYANGPIHMGHVAGCYLPPDIFSRYQRMRGNMVLMVSGSDEHGTPITVTAEKEGVEPWVVAKRYHRINSESLKGLGIRFDLFTETSTENHKRVAQNFFLRLKDRGYIYPATMRSPFCPKCNRFLPDRYVEGTCPHCGNPFARGDQCDACGRTLDPEELVDPKCKICGTTPEMRETEHFFFRLSAFEKPLLEYLSDKDYWKSNTLRFTRNWLKMGLRDRPITRDITWGIEVPLPGYENKRLYVWFEAVIGYLSASMEWAERSGKPDAWEEFWKDPACRHYYFLGKDNIPFHTIIWPAMLMGHGGLNLPYNVVANEYMHFRGEKLSKSRGNVVTIKDYLAHLPPDLLRYYLTANMPENRDTDFSWEDFITRVNEELVSTLGNFVHRVLSFTHRHFGEIPPPPDTLEPLDEEFLEKVKKSVDGVAENLEKCHFRDGLKHLMDIAREGNRYLDAAAPWKTVKTDKKRCGDTLHVSLRAVKAIAVAGYPFMPFSMARLWSFLGEPGNPEKAGWDAAQEPPETGHKLEKPEVLFKKLTEDDIKPILEPGPEETSAETKAAETETEKEKGGGEKMGETPETLDLRVGVVREIEDHPNADKLYVMKVDMGDETRTLVAGLKPYYAPEELRGKALVIVANLKPAKLRGVLSRGMLLAADDGQGKVSVLTPEKDVPPGTQIKGTTRGAPQISFDRFLKHEITVEKDPERDGERVFGAIKTAGGERVFMETEDGVRITTDRPIKPGSRVR